MTSGNCCKSALKLYSFSLRRQIAITLLVTGFLLLLCPGILLREYTKSDYHRYALGSELALWTMIIFTATLILGVILLCYNHAHLFSRKTADLYYALPIKRDSLLAVRFGAAFTGAAFAATTAFLGLGIFALLPGLESGGFWAMLQCWLLCLMLLLLCMSTLLLFLVNSGSIFHFLFSSAVVCVGIPVLFVIGWESYEAAAVGVVAESEWLKYVSPFGYSYLTIGENLDRVNVIGLRGSTVAISLGCSVLFLALSFVMHHNRRTERSGSAFSASIVPYLITVIAAAVGGYVIAIMFSWNTEDMDFWLFLIHGALLVAIASGAIASKGFRKLWRWLICGGVAVVVMLGLMLGFEALGEKDSRYIPPKDEIQSITIEGTYNTPEVTFTEDFDLILAFHALKVANIRGERGQYAELCVEYDLDTSVMIGDITMQYATTEILNPDVTFTYTLKNGREITRSYWSNSLEELLLIFRIGCTDTYAQSWAFTEYPEGYAQYYYNDKDKNVHDSNTLTPEECTLLMDTFGAELQKADPKEILTMDYVTLELENGKLWQQLCVPRSFTETLTLAEELLD